MFTTRRQMIAPALTRRLPSPMAPTNDSNILHVQPGCGVQSFQDEQRCREERVCDGRCDMHLPSGPRFPFERARHEGVLRKQVKIAAPVASHTLPPLATVHAIFGISKRPFRRKLPRRGYSDSTGLSGPSDGRIHPRIEKSRQDRDWCDECKRLQNAFYRLICQ